VSQTDLNDFTQHTLGLAAGNLVEIYDCIHN